MGSDGWKIYVKLQSVGRFAVLAVNVIGMEKSRCMIGVAIVYLMFIAKYLINYVKHTSLVRQLNTAISNSNLVQNAINKANKKHRPPLRLTDADCKNATNNDNLFIIYN